MAAALIARLTENLKCAICLETVHNPRSLNCEHSYCKHCLDQLLDFAPNGSATIKCPQGCDKVTRITCKGTTWDLTLNYMLKNTLDILETTIMEGTTDDSDNAAAVKRNCGKCPREACYYCSSCAVYMCNTCPDSHRSSFVPVEYRPSLKNFVIMCAEHASEALIVCGGLDGRCGRFLCVYCFYREGCHDGSYKSMEEEETDLKARLVQVNAIHPEVSEEELQGEVAETRMALERELQVRKLTRASQYFEFLVKQEEAVLDEFDRQSRHYGSRFDSISYLRDCLSKNGSDLLIEREKIVDRLNVMGPGGSVPTATAHISKSSTFFDRDPLGSVHLSYSRTDSNNNSTASTTEQQKRFSSGIEKQHLSAARLPSLKALKDLIVQETNFDISARGRLIDTPSPSPSLVGGTTQLRKIDDKYSPTAAVIFLEVREVSKMQLNRFIFSDTVSASKLRWKLGIGKIQKMENGQMKEHLGVYLYLEDRETGSLPVSVNAVFQVSSQKKHLKRPMRHTFTEEDRNDGRGYDFLTWDVFIDPENGYVVNDVAMFEVSVVAMRDPKPPVRAREVLRATQEQPEVVQGELQSQATVA